MTPSETQKLLDVLNRIATALEKSEYHIHLVLGQRLAKVGDSLLVESEKSATEC